MSRDSPPECDSCKKPLTISHIFNECQKLSYLRHKYSITGIEVLKDDADKIKKCLQFVKESNFYDLI